MAEIPTNNVNNGYVQVNPINNVANAAQNQGTVQIQAAPAQNLTSQIYQYPQASLYDANQKTAASGVNIYIYNPSALGGGGACPAPVVNAQPQGNMPAQTQAIPAAPINADSNNQSQPIANTPINDNKDKNDKKLKPIVELTDDYIKKLESYLKSPEKDMRKAGIVELIKRFEEDQSRHDDPALTALLNIALMDPVPNNRQLAMSVISSGGASGDNNTAALLKNLTSSDKVYGQEAKMAGETMLNVNNSKTFVPKE